MGSWIWIQKSNISPQKNKKIKPEDQKNMKISIFYAVIFYAKNLV
jgi:hypothetical protein